MKAIRPLCASLLTASVAVFAGLGDAITDAELKQDVWEYLTTRFCGSRGGRRLAHARVLTDYIRFDGNTNRLAAVLVEVASSNNTWAAERAIKELEKYGTPAQLPFLYSCATNPAVGDKAVKAVLRIEGVTSNSVAMLHSYLSFTNCIARQQAYNRAVASRDFLACLQNYAVGIELKESTLQIIRTFAADINMSNSIVDEALVAADSTYRYSKRRLAVMRSAHPRCFNDFQATYVTNAINELVAYPEANLPE